MARNNGGVFPFVRVYESIDGRVALRAHGSRDMPVWGDVYKVGGAQEHDNHGYPPEIFVRGRLLALIDYLNRIRRR